jgi:hypothetical protein
MELQDLVIVEVFCRECQIEITLIDELEDFGLIEIIQDNGMKYIHSDHLQQVQKIVKFYSELNVNKEGIEIVLNLLERLNQQNQELKFLQDKLKLYE